jgi:cobalt/nickel transport system ATP-binding protein
VDELIRLHNVVAGYDSGHPGGAQHAAHDHGGVGDAHAADGHRHRVLDDLTLCVRRGEKLVVLGANGAGKSTLLKLLAGLVAPTRGAYEAFGAVVTPARLRERAFARDFRRRVGLLFQNPDAMLFQPTVADEIGFGPRQLGLPDVDRRIERWAGAFGLAGRLEAAPFRLSGGEKQKVCLAALLAHDPELLLLDEPTAALDPRSTGWLIDLLAALPQTVIVSSHNLSLAAELGRRALVLADGRLAHDGPVDLLFADLELMIRANLAHRHRHRHDGVEHRHYHTHDWEG